MIAMPQAIAAANRYLLIFSKNKQKIIFQQSVKSSSN